MGISTLFMLLVLGGMLFFMTRTQKKQQEQRETTLNSMKPGSAVVTIGGLHGVISEIDKAKNTVTLDCDGIYLEFDRASIRTVNPPGGVTTSSADAVTTTDTVDEKIDVQPVEVKETVTEEVKVEPKAETDIKEIPVSDLIDDKAKTAPKETIEVVEADEIIEPDEKTKG